ncbi:MAG: hypothetical protein KDC80_06255, partial [Saprospiraceae bacterium]|nr:hypothetical protein [Saprospiraceae bacterium]
MEFESPTERYSDLRINYPIYIMDTISYEIDVDTALDIKLPENISIESRFGHYRGNYSVEKNIVTIA